MSQSLPPPLPELPPLSQAERHERELRASRALAEALAPELQQIADELARLRAAIDKLTGDDAEQKGSPS